VATRLVLNKRKTINNYLRYVPSKKRGHFATNSNDILPVVAKMITFLNYKASWNIMILLANLQQIIKC
jgi:hypothetical protein